MGWSSLKLNILATSLVKTRLCSVCSLLSTIVLQVHLEWYQTLSNRQWWFRCIVYIAFIAVHSMYFFSDVVLFDDDFPMFYIVLYNLAVAFINTHSQIAQETFSRKAWFCFLHDWLLLFCMFAVLQIRDVNVEQLTLVSSFSFLQCCWSSTEQLVIVWLCISFAYFPVFCVFLYFLRVLVLSPLLHKTSTRISTVC